jgi:hypothetical protein
MLRKKDVEWVKANRALHTRKPRVSMSSRERARYFRIRKNIKATLEVLTTLLKNMPEQQLEQIFNKDNVTPFLKALFSLETDNLKKRRKRVIELWNFLLMQCSSYTYGHKLVGRDVMQILTGGIPNTIQAIYYATRLKLQ